MYITLQFEGGSLDFVCFAVVARVLAFVSPREGKWCADVSANRSPCAVVNITAML